MSCPHPFAQLRDPSRPSVGDAFSGSSVCVEATCTSCDSLVLVDARITEVTELE